MRQTTVLSLALATLSSASAIKRDDFPTADAIATAVTNWQSDTQTVSQFLNFAESVRSIGSNTDDNVFKSKAQQALDAELDELNHKAILDNFFRLDPPGDDSINNANNTLVDQGTFQIVVDNLKDMANNGQSVINDIDIINTDRCGKVLPAIDTYFSSIESFLVGSLDLTVTAPTGGAVRPGKCGGSTDGGNFGTFGTVPAK